MLMVGHRFEVLVMGYENSCRTRRFIRPLTVREFATGGLLMTVFGLRRLTRRRLSSTFGNNNMMRVHDSILGIFLLFLLPCACFSGLLGLAAICTEYTHGFSWNLFAALLILVIPIFLVIWAIRMMLRFGWKGVVVERRRRLYFYLVLFLYCGAWVVLPFSRDGISFMLFSTGQMIGILFVLILPIIVTLTVPIKLAEQVAASDR
ncbi:MAG: hypothetical protein H7A51_13870 [Akkermansiaceae bacterium]|nr:hypothetical protein [Akkermansiaceae bacterium]